MLSRTRYSDMKLCGMTARSGVRRSTNLFAHPVYGDLSFLIGEVENESM